MTGPKAPPKASIAFWSTLLVDLRREKGISQRHLAYRTGIPRDTLRKIESGESSAHVHNLESILAVYGLELDALKADS